jgi:hypothetical protein
VLAGIEAEVADLELKIFSGERNPDFMQEYLKEEKWAAVPVFVFFAPEFNELAHWHERPALADKGIGKLREEMSEKPENEIDVAIVRLIGKNIVEYQQETVKELIGLLSA